MNKWIVTDNNPGCFKLSLATKKNNRGETISSYLAGTEIRFMTIQHNWTISTMDSPAFDNPLEAISYANEQLDIDAECDYKECVKTIVEHNLNRLRLNLVDMSLDYIEILSNIIIVGSLLDNDYISAFFEEILKWSKNNKDKIEYFINKSLECLDITDYLISGVDKSADNS